MKPIYFPARRCRIKKGLEIEKSGRKKPESVKGKY